MFRTLLGSIFVCVSFLVFVAWIVLNATQFSAVRSIHNSVGA